MRGALAGCLARPPEPRRFGGGSPRGPHVLTGGRAPGAGAGDAGSGKRPAPHLRMRAAPAAPPAGVGAAGRKRGGARGAERVPAGSAVAGSAGRMGSGRRLTGEFRDCRMEVSLRDASGAPKPVCTEELEAESKCSPVAFGKGSVS